MSITYSAPQFYHTDISWSLLAIHWYHSNTLNPLLYGICDVWHNLKNKITRMMSTRTKIYVHKLPGDKNKLKPTRGDRHLDSLSQVFPLPLLVKYRLSSTTKIKVK